MPPDPLEAGKPGAGSMAVIGMKFRPATPLLLLALAACQPPAGSSSAPSPESSSSFAASDSANSAGRIIFGRFAPTTDEWLVFMIKPDGSDERQIVLPGSNGVTGFSPDGSRLMAYADNDQGLLFVGIANADGSGWRILRSPDPTLNLGCTGWSPDGSRLACEGWDDSDPSRNGIYTVRASDGADLVRLTTTPAGLHDIPGAYAPDGSRLVVARDPIDGSTGKTLTVNVDGTDLKELPVHYGGGYEWSPDGTAILAGKAGTLFVLDASGENPIPIEIEDASGYENDYASGATWSPDARQIVFSWATGEMDAPDLFVMNRDGSGLTRLTYTADDYEEGADWSP
jgi:Tol biopolymer transport system component